MPPTSSLTLVPGPFLHCFFGLRQVYVTLGELTILPVSLLRPILIW
jgi:hypothetical protein